MGHHNLRHQHHIWQIAVLVLYPLPANLTHKAVSQIKMVTKRDMITVEYQSGQHRGNTGNNNDSRPEKQLPCKPTGQLN